MLTLLASTIIYELIVKILYKVSVLYIWNFWSDVFFLIKQYSTSSNPDTVKVSIWIYNNDPTDTAYSVTVKEDLTAGLLADYGTVALDPTTYTSVFDKITINNGRKAFTWSVGDITGDIDVW